MIAIDLKPKAKKFIQSLPPKHQRQVKDSILALSANSQTHDARPLIGYALYMRVDVGEYRIVYKYEDNLITVILVGKRNGDEVYRIAKRLLK